MTKAPATITQTHWLYHPEDMDDIQNVMTDVEYTRTDIANAAVVDLIAQNAELIKRIAELEAAVEEIYLEYDPSDHGGISEIMFDLASAVRAKGATT